MKIQKAKRAFLEAKQDLSPRTLEHYSQALDILERVFRKIPKNPEQIRKALNEASTIWVKDAWWRAWSTFFHWYSHEHDKPNVMEKVERPKLPEIEMKALEPEELAMLLAAADNTRDKAILSLALDSGVRASEFGRLRILDVGTDTIRLWGKGNRQDSVPISPEGRHLLQLLLDEDGQREPRALIFPGQNGGALSRFAVYHIVRRCMEKAGIAGPKLGPHCLRHSLGKNYIANGGDAFTLKRVMRHRDIATTQKYVNLAMKDVIEQHHQHSPLRDAIRGAQGVLIEQEVEEILERA